MPAKSLNASPSSVHHTFDSHSIISRFEPSCGPDVFVGRLEEPEAAPQHETIASPQVPVNELGIYEAPEYTEGCLSPLEAFNETVEPLATYIPEEPLYEEPPGHIRSPILSK
jgi:hypothetical protein